MRTFRWMAGVLGLVACGGGGDGGTKPVAVDKVVITPTNPAAMASFNQTVALNAQAVDQNDNPVSGVTITWTSSAPATVSLTPTTGTNISAKAVGNGSSTITASAGGKSAQVTINVAQLFDRLTLNKTAVALAPTGTDQLSATLADAGGSALTLGGLPAATFTTDNGTVADVSSTGLVTANADGTAHITASATFAGVTKTAQATVTVATHQPQTVSVSTVGTSWSPAVVNIQSGDRVEFTIDGIHNLLFAPNNPAPQSNVGSGTTPIGGQGTTVTRTFTVKGTYNYQCGVHAGMTGQVIVQ